jgi:hypothetical protein
MANPLSVDEFEPTPWIKIRKDLTDRQAVLNEAFAKLSTKAEQLELFQAADRKIVTEDQAYNGFPFGCNQFYLMYTPEERQAKVTKWLEHCDKECESLRKQNTKES